MAATDRGGCALVTGGSRGIGAAVARALASDGRSVAVLYREDKSGAEGTVGEIVAGGGVAMAVECEVTDGDAIDAAFSAVEGRLGTVSVLVNNAGTYADGLVRQLSDEDWHTVIETNLAAGFRTIRRAIMPMVRARFGRIVNIASVVGPRANAGQANYAASKAGLIGLTKTVAAEVARRGVTVNAVAPGLIETRLTAEIDASSFLEAIPARRAGTADEVAACVRFLASPEASYVTGATLFVDGGMSA